jgi:hypothetical protein
MFVIVTQQVQKTVKRENPVLGAEGMTGRAGLARSSTCRNHDITKEPDGPRELASGQIGSKRQDVRHMIDPAISPIQRPYMPIRHQSERDGPARSSGCGSGQPVRQPANAQGASGSIGDRHIETPATRSLGRHDAQECRPLLPLENDS